MNRWRRGSRRPWRRWWGFPIVIIAPWRRRRRWW